MDLKIKLSTLDPIEVFNSNLKSKYKATLFDFAYLLAISLNEGFLPNTYFGLEKKELNWVKKLLITTRLKLSKYDFLQDLIKEVEKGLHYIYRQRDSGISEKTKLILLWVQLLIKEYKRPLKDPVHEEDMTITEKTVTRIDWNDYLTLLRWFYKRLSDFSYSSLIKPRLDRQEEKKYAKSLLEKKYSGYDSDYERRASEALMMYKLAQHYFLNEGPIPQKVDPQRVVVYPLVRVGFYKDRIETAELRENGKISIKRVNFLDGQKKCCEPEEKEEDVRYPTMVFQNEDPFVIRNYSPPGYPSSDRIDQFKRMLLLDLKRKRNRE